MLKDTIQYWEAALKEEQANKYFEILKNSIPWQQDELIIFGRKIRTKRLVAWFGDKNYEYVYSHTSKKALKWTPELLELKELVEIKSKISFNSCLLNYYHSGEEGMGWHSDDEKTLESPIHIASLSLGSERRFDFRTKDKNKKESIWLANGSLLLMKYPNQERYQHSLPKTRKIKEARINLTFRKMKE